MRSSEEINQSSNLPPGKRENTPSPAGSQAENDFSIKTHKRSYRVAVYPHSIEFLPPERNENRSRRLAPPRGQIKSFSKRARFRLFFLLSKLRDITEVKPLFISLTYHYSHTKDTQKHRKDIHLWLTELRRYDPGAAYIWRLEYQERGAPHFHLIVYPGTQYRKTKGAEYTAKLSLFWHRIADPNSKAHESYGFHQRIINDYRMACAYVSKYIAKTDGIDMNIVGSKHYGNSRNLPIEIDSLHIMTEGLAKNLIERIRKWLVYNGKEQYATPEWFNYERPQIVFLSVDEFEYLMNEAARDPIKFGGYTHDDSLSGMYVAFG